MERTTILNLRKKEELKKVIVSSGHSIVKVFRDGNWELRGEHKNNSDEIYSLKCDSKYSESELSNIIEWLEHIIGITKNYKNDHFLITYKSLIEDETVPLEEYLYNPLPTIREIIGWLPGYTRVEWNHGLKLFRLFKDDELTYVSFNNYNSLTSYLYQDISTIEDNDYYFSQCKNIRQLHALLFKTTLTSELTTRSNIEDNLILNKDELLRIINLSEQTTVNHVYEFLGLSKRLSYGDEIIITPIDINRLPPYIVINDGLISFCEFNEFFFERHRERENFDEYFVRRYIRLSAQSHKRQNNDWIKWREQVEWNYAMGFLDQDHYLIAMDEIISAEVKILDTTPGFGEDYLKCILSQFENNEKLIKVTDVLNYFEWPIPSNTEINDKYFSLTFFENGELYDFMGYLFLDEVMRILIESDLE